MRGSGVGWDGDRSSKIGGVRLRRGFGEIWGAGVGLGAEGAGGEFLGAEGGAVVGEGEAGAGEGLLCGAVGGVEEAGGGRDQRLGPAERGIGEGVDAAEGRGAELALGQGGEKAGGRGSEVVVLREHVPLVVHAERALADAEAKLLAEAHEGRGVGELLVLEPGAELLVLRGAQVLQPGIAADFARRAGAGVGRASGIFSVHALGLAAG